MTSRLAFILAITCTALVVYISFFEASVLKEFALFNSGYLKGFLAGASLGLFLTAWAQWRKELNSQQE